MFNGWDPSYDGTALLVSPPVSLTPHGGMAADQHPHARARAGSQVAMTTPMKWIGSWNDD